MIDNHTSLHMIFFVTIELLLLPSFGTGSYLQASDDIQLEIVYQVLYLPFIAAQSINQ